GNPLDQGEENGRLAPGRASRQDPGSHPDRGHIQERRLVVPALAVAKKDPVTGPEAQYPGAVLRIAARQLHDGARGQGCRAWWVGLVGTSAGTKKEAVHQDVRSASKQRHSPRARSSRRVNPAATSRTCTAGAASSMIPLATSRPPG